MDLALGKQLLHGQRAPGNQPTTAAGTVKRLQFDFDVASVTGNFQAHRALSGDDVRVVEGWQQHCTAAGRQIGSDALPLLRVPIVEYDSGARSLRAQPLDSRRIPGHDDGRLHAQPPGGQGNSLCMISRRKRHHPGAPFGLAEAQESIEGAPYLETAAMLQGLCLYQHTASC